MPKYKIYTIIALVLMTLGFTIPVIGFHGMPDRIKAGQEVPAYAETIWNFYTKIQHKNHLLPDDVKGDLSKMIERGAEITMPSLPVWSIVLSAPQYPQEAFPNGIPLFIHVDGYGGDVGEMNTLNHYIGMYPVEYGGNTERAISPHYLLISTLCMLAFLYYNGRGNSLLMILPIIAWVFFLSAWAGWLYWYGHNMQDWGAFTIKPFMPTALGEGKVAQFTTSSYPDIGFWVMIAMSVLSILAIFSKRKYLREKESE
ncbi:MAG: cytochrome C [Campylobacter sp.]|nr:cytochrome C [Campylobacter sp.]